MNAVGENSFLLFFVTCAPFSFFNKQKYSIFKNVVDTIDWHETETKIHWTQCNKLTSIFMLTPEEILGQAVLAINILPLSKNGNSTRRTSEATKFEIPATARENVKHD